MSKPLPGREDALRQGLSPPELAAVVGDLEDALAEGDQLVRHYERTERRATLLLVGTTLVALAVVVAAAVTTGPVPFRSELINVLLGGVSAVLGSATGAVFARWSYRRRGPGASPPPPGLVTLMANMRRERLALAEALLPVPRRDRP